MNNIDVVVVGIMPRGFRVYTGPGTNVAERIDIWAPGAPDFGGISRSVPTVARLKPNITLGAAQRAIDVFMPAFMAAHASSYRLGPVKLTLVRLDEDVVRDVKPALVTLAGAVAFVLLIACANLTNLLLARACSRTRELAVRRAIGASRPRLIAQLAMEGVVLWAIGAVAGLVVAQWTIRALLQLAPAALPRREHIGIDLTVASFAIGVSLVCAIVFGLVPGWQATREDLTGMLKQDPAASPDAAATRGLLLAGQVALSLVLLVGAGLMVRAGRSVVADDNARSAPVVMIDERLASALWPGESAIGRRLLLGSSTATRQWAEVVGVVSHVQLQDLRGDTRPQIWSTYRARPLFSMSVVARTDGDPRVLAGTLKRAIERLGPRRPVMDIQPLDDYVDAASADTRFALFVLGAFAVLAAILAAIGVYGVVAYTTAQRTREIAVRLALGADARRIVALVVRDGLGWAIVGMVAGLGTAYGLSRYLSSLLFEVDRHDPSRSWPSRCCSARVRSSPRRFPRFARCVWIRCSPCGLNKPRGMIAKLVSG